MLIYSLLLAVLPRNRLVPDNQIWSLWSDNNIYCGIYYLACSNSLGGSNTAQNVCVWDWQNAPDTPLATVALKAGKVYSVLRNVCVAQCLLGFIVAKFAGFNFPEEELNSKIYFVYSFPFVRYHFSRIWGKSESKKLNLLAYASHKANLCFIP